MASARFSQGLGLGVIAFLPIERGQVVEARGGVRMLGAQHLLPDGQRPLEQRLGLGVIAFLPIEQSQGVEARGGVRMVGAERLLV